jgi:hypothetical protein
MKYCICLCLVTSAFCAYGDTNVPSLYDVDNSFSDSFIQLLNSLYGLPSSLLVGITCIIFGYALRLAKNFPNNGIPLACILWGMTFTPLISDIPAHTSFRVWLGRNILLGAIIGAGAWLAHKWLLKRVEDRVPLLGSMLSHVDKSGQAVQKDASN